MFIFLLFEVENLDVVSFDVIVGDLGCSWLLVYGVKNYDCFVFVSGWFVCRVFVWKGNFFI